MSNVLFDYLKVGSVYFANLTAAPGTSYAALDAGTISVAGQTLDVTIAGPWTEGVIRIIGQDLTFVTPLSMNLDAATITIAGQDLQLPYGQFFVNMANAMISVAGQDLGLAIVVPQVPVTELPSNRIILGTSSNRISLTTSG